MAGDPTARLSRAIPDGELPRGIDGGDRPRGRVPDDRDRVFSGIRLSVPAFMMSPEWSVNKAGALAWRRHMRNIVDEVGEIIAKTTDDHTLIGGHHRLAVAASLGRKLFWKDTGEPVQLDPFFKGSSHRNTA
jgi:hypothetical protein